MSEQIQKIQEQITPVLKQAGVLRASIFGSVARGEATENSDVDILVELPNSASLLDLVGLKQDLELVLEKKVDVVEYGAIKPLLRQSILNNQVVII